MISASKKYFTKESKILLLGGTGFLGSYFYEEFMQRGYKNIFISGTNLKGGENKLAINLYSDDTIAIIENSHFDLIINLSGQISNPIIDCLKLNSRGIMNLINAVKHSDTFLIQVSTVGIFGSCAYADEETIPNPQTPYSVAKAIAELLLVQALDPKKYAIIRLSNIYGENQPKGLFAYLFKSALSDLKLNFNNDGSLVRYYLHAQDSASSIIDAIENMENQLIGRFNLLGPDKFNIFEIIQLFEQLNKIKFETVFEPVKPYDNAVEVSGGKFETFFKPNFTNNIGSFIQSNFNYGS